MESISHDQQYLSTRQSAKILQVSLGTVQKMVEMGELVAWKTRGGHRRILASSLQQQLRRRKQSMQQRATNHQYLALGIFKRQENRTALESAVKEWSVEVELMSSLDNLEGLMQAVSHYPDAIYLDSLIPPIEQLHLIHYLTKNIQTRRIPLLIDEAFVQLHPGVLEMAKENASYLKPNDLEKEALVNELNELPEKANLFTYSTNNEDDSEKHLKSLETLFTQAFNSLI